MSKTINITNGVGTSELINGTYTVTANVVGYNNSTISPASIEMVDGTNTYDFTISADGTLTLHVTEDGTSTGTPIVGATFVRTDSEGNEYGSPIVTNAEGNAIFNNVPYASTSAPLIYYKQIASDGNHEFVTTVSNTTMADSTETIEIENTPGPLRTINLTDANYENLKVDIGQLTFTN